MALLSIPSNTEAIPALFSLSRVHVPASHPEAFIAQALSLSWGLLASLRLRCALSPAQCLACTFGCWGLTDHYFCACLVPCLAKRPRRSGVQPSQLSISPAPRTISTYRVLRMCWMSEWKKGSLCTYRVSHSIKKPIFCEQAEIWSSLSPTYTLKFSWM